MSEEYEDISVQDIIDYRDEIIEDLPRTQKWRHNNIGIQETRPNKKQKFHHPKNLEQIANTLFAKHVKNGGDKKASYIVDLVIKEVPLWLSKNNPDTYESLVAFDEDSEIEAINHQFINDFIEKHHNVFMKNPYTTITATHKFDMYDYRNFDAYQGKRTFTDTGEKTTNYRYRNTIPVTRTCNHARNHEQDITEGLRNRGALENIDRGFKHNRISDIADGDYSAVDDQDQYYHGSGSAKDNDRFYGF
jgi:hypothetical protein